MNPLKKGSANRRAPEKLIQRISENLFARNLVLVVCAVIIFFFAASLFLNIFTRHGKYETVPDFSGMTVEEAIRAGRKGKLRIEINDSLYVPIYAGGIILDQNPDQGKKVKSGRRIFVTVNSFQQKMVKIPYVTDFSLRQAKNNLEVVGLEIEKLIYREDIAANYVLEERYKGEIITPESRMEGEVGSGVTLLVGMSGNTTTTIPKVIGFPLKEAKSRLWEAGLNIGKIEKEDGINPLNEIEARVWIQAPEQSRRVALGATVSLRLTLDGKKVEKGSDASDKAAKNISATQQQTEN